MSDTATPAAIDVAGNDGWTVTSASASLPDRTPDGVRADLDTGLDAASTDKSPDTPAQAETTPATPAQTAKPAEPKKKPSGESRIAEMQARIHAKTRELREIERTLEAKRRDLDGTPAAPSAKPAAPTSPENATTVRTSLSQDPPTKDELANMPLWEDYDKAEKTFDEFQRDLVAWNRDRIDARLAAEAERIEQKVLEKLQHRSTQAQLIDDGEKQAQVFLERQTAVIEAHPDYFELIDERLKHINQTPFLVDVVSMHPQGPALLYHWAQHPAECEYLSQIELPQAVMDVVSESDDAIALLSHLAHHPEEIDRLTELNRTNRASAIVALTKLETKLAASGVKSGSPAPAPVTRASAPLRPVAGTRTTGGATDPDDLEFGPDYIARMNERDRTRRRA